MRAQGAGGRVRNLSIVRRSVRGQIGGLASGLENTQLRHSIASFNAKATTGV